MTVTGQGSASTTVLTNAVGTWTLDPAATTVVLHTKAMWGLAKVRATFAATEGTGTVTADGRVSGRLVIDAASVDSGTKRRDNHLRSKDFFEVSTHPSFVYDVTGATPAADGTVALAGTLTIHGAVQPVEFTATVTPSATDRTTVTAEVDIDRARWGITWAKMGARLANHVIINAVFTRQPA